MKTNTSISPLRRLLTACGLFAALPFTLLLTAIIAFRFICFVHAPFACLETPYYIVCFVGSIAIICFATASYSHIFED